MAAQTGTMGRFRDFIGTFPDAGTISTAEAIRRFKDKVSGKIAYSTAGAVMRDIRRKRVEATAAKDLLQSATAASDQFKSDLFTRAKLVIDLAQRLGGLDNLIDMANELRKAGF